MLSEDEAAETENTEQNEYIPDRKGAGHRSSS